MTSVNRLYEKNLPEVDATAAREIVVINFMIIASVPIWATMYKFDFMITEQSNNKRLYLVGVRRPTLSLCH